jgi:acyl carrier protein
VENSKHVERSEIAEQVMGSLQAILDEKETSPVDSIDESTNLIGRQSVLDSLGLVNLLVDLEQKIEEKYECLITLADERAMSQKSSPFRTVQSLTDYVCMLINEARQHVGA